jgi:hypothetical protein
VFGGWYYVGVSKDELSEGGVESVPIDTRSGGEHQVGRRSVPENPRSEFLVYWWWLDKFAYMV